MLRGCKSTFRYYNMDKPGKALIFNHNTFNLPGMKERKGTEHDVKKLKESLTRLNIDVNVYNDLSLKKIRNTLSEESKNVDKNTISCFMVVVMTHGKPGKLYSRYTLYEIEELWTNLDQSKLQDIPKLFFIQACRGEIVELANMDDISYDCKVDYQSMKSPSFADYLQFYSSCPGYKASRSERKGTPFIQSICEVFDEYGTEMDLMDLTVEINDRVVKKCQKFNFNQIPELSSKLRKFLRFTEKNQTNGNADTNEASEATVDNSCVSYYNMDKPGLALIFNHNEFDDKSLPKREGTQNDVANLKGCLHRLNFIIKCYEDRRWTEIMDIMNKVSSIWSNENISSLMIIILTYGDSGLLCSYDHAYSIDMLLRKLLPPKCKKFLEIPLMIFVEASRGQLIHYDIYDDSFQYDSHVNTYKKSTKPSQPDILQVYSSIDGYASCRKTDQGSFFIYTLCEILNQNAGDFDLMHLLTLVRERMITNQTLKIIQKPEILSSLKKPLKFNTNMNHSAIGINLGTQNSYVAIIKKPENEMINPEAEVCLTYEREIKLPSKVAIYKNKFTAGKALKEANVDNIDVIFNIVTPRDPHTIQDGNNIFKTKHKGRLDHENMRLIIKKNDDEKSYCLKEMTAKLIYELKSIAEDCLKLPVKHAVIAVPPYLSEDQINLIKEACSSEELNAFEIIKQTYASIYDKKIFNIFKETGNYCVFFNLSEITFNVSIFWSNKINYEEKGPDWYYNLGGENFTESLVKHCVQFYKQKKNTNLELTKKQLKHIKQNCEKAKIKLTNVQEASIPLNLTKEDTAIICKVSQVKFEDLNNELFSRIIGKVKQSVKKANLTPNDITACVLLGKSTNMPKITNLLQENYPGAEIIKFDDANSIIAQGAAIRANILLNASINHSESLQ